MKDHDTSDTRSLEAANALLRRKLQTDHGMIESISRLSPELENIWLNSVYNFEENWKASKPVKVFEHLGRPSLPRLDHLTAADVPYQLQRLDDLMMEKGVALDRGREHKAATIYRFITEELFDKEMPMRPGGNFVWHFIYEEFYPGGA